MILEMEIPKMYVNVDSVFFLTVKLITLLIC